MDPLSAFSIPAVDHDILSTIEYWAFRLALLVVFLLWLVRHVIHEFHGFRAEIRKWRAETETAKILHTPSP